MSKNAVAQEPDAKRISNYVPNAKLVGKGMFSYYFWDVLPVSFMRLKVNTPTSPPLH